MRLRAALALTLVFPAVFTISYLLQYSGRSGRDAGTAVDRFHPTGHESARPSQPVPVASNRGPEVLDGFRGDVHPLLFGATRLEVTAEWSSVGKGRDQLYRFLKPELYSWFTDLQPALPRQTYSERDFSAFLPTAVGDVGQIWALEPDKMARILRQFHPRPSMHLAAPGRRAGPDGAFAILRAVSSSYLDIVFRIHAEFYLTPDDWPPAGMPHFGAWYTPAYFSGRVLLNRRLGTVQQFRLGLATGKALNVHLTVEAAGDNRQAHDVVRVERMELTGGETLADISWTKSLTMAEAEERLAKVFFKFLETDWVPFDQVLGEARRQGRPIFAVVSWGAFDDQSC
jgi:hypothetical protein